MRWWPFHRRARTPNGEAAQRAKREAAVAVVDARRRRHEIGHELNTFTAQVEAAMAGRRPR